MSIEKCHSLDCALDPEYLCSCSGDPLSFCKKHIEIHTVEEGNHEITQNFTDITLTKKEVFISQCVVSLRVINEIKKNIKSTAQKDINNFTKELAGYIEIFEKEESLISKSLEFISNNSKIIEKDTPREEEIFIKKYLDLPKIIIENLKFREKEILEATLFTQGIRTATEENNKLKLELEELKTTLEKNKENFILEKEQLNKEKEELNKEKEELNKEKDLLLEEMKNKEASLNLENENIMTEKIGIEKKMQDIISEHNKSIENILFDKKNKEDSLASEISELTKQYENMKAEKNKIEQSKNLEISDLKMKIEMIEKNSSS